MELKDEFVQMGVDLLGITETKEMGKGIITVVKGNILIYSGVKQDKYTSSRGGCIRSKYPKSSYSSLWTQQQIRINSGNNYE